MSKELRESIKNKIFASVEMGMHFHESSIYGNRNKVLHYIDEIMEDIQRESSKAVIEELERQNKHYLSKGGHLLLYDDENGNPVYLSERLEALKEQIGEE